MSDFKAMIKKAVKNVDLDAVRERALENSRNQGGFKTDVKDGDHICVVKQAALSLWKDGRTGVVYNFLVDDGGEDQGKLIPKSQPVIDPKDEAKTEENIERVYQDMAAFGFDIEEFDISDLETALSEIVSTQGLRVKVNVSTSKATDQYPEPRRWVNIRSADWPENGATTEAAEEEEETQEEEEAKPAATTAKRGRGRPPKDAATAPAKAAKTTKAEPAPPSEPVEEVEDEEEEETEEEETEETEEEEEQTLQVGSTIQFTFNGETLTGKVEYFKDSDGETKIAEATKEDQFAVTRFDSDGKLRKVKISNIQAVSN